MSHANRSPDSILEQLRKAGLTALQYIFDVSQPHEEYIHQYLHGVEPEQLFYVDDLPARPLHPRELQPFTEMWAKDNSDSWTVVWLSAEPQYLYPEEVRSLQQDTMSVGRFYIETSTDYQPVLLVNHPETGELVWGMAPAVKKFERRMHRGKDDSRPPLNRHATAKLSPEDSYTLSASDFGQLNGQTLVTGETDQSGGPTAAPWSVSDFDSDSETVIGRLSLTIQVPDGELSLRETENPRQLPSVSDITYAVENSSTDSIETGAELSQPELRELLQE